MTDTLEAKPCESPSRRAAAAHGEQRRRHRAWIKRLQHAFAVVKTRCWWGWRLHALGRRSHLGRAQHVKCAASVSIGSHVMIEDQFILADVCPEQGDQPKIVIGDGCTLMYRFQVNAAQAVTIGRNVLAASNVLITDFDHVLEPGGIPVTRSRAFVAAPVHIEDNCWLGQNAVVLKGVTIGHDSIVGANSVVTKNVPPYSIVGGNPARVIKSLQPQPEAART